MGSQREVAAFQPAMPSNVSELPVSVPVLLAAFHVSVMREALAPSISQYSVALTALTVLSRLDIANGPPAGDVAVPGFSWK